MWRNYDVTLEMSPLDNLHIVSVAAPTPAKARYEAYLTLAEVSPDLTFAAFLQRVRKVRLTTLSRQRGKEAYAYIRQFYGLDFQPGQEVMIRDEGLAWEGRSARVITPDSNSHYVRVEVAGEMRPLNFHPLSLTALEHAGAPVRDAA